MKKSIEAVGMRRKEYESGMLIIIGVSTWRSKLFLTGCLARDYDLRRIIYRAFNGGRLVNLKSEIANENGAAIPFRQGLAFLIREIRGSKKQKIRPESGRIKPFGGVN